MAKVISNSDEPSKGGRWGAGGPSGQVGNTSGPAKSVGPQKPGVSSQQGSGSDKWASGGNTHMQPHSGAGKAKPGVTSNPENGSTGGWATGGPSGGMAPNRGSQPQKGGRSSSY